MLVAEPLTSGRMVDAHRVLLVDDDVVVRAFFENFFAGQPEWEIVASACNGEEGVAAYAAHEPDLVLMDLQMPGISGVEATRRIKDDHPEACVIVMTSFVSDDLIVAALRVGAAGYLEKGADGEAVLQGLRQALRGEMPLSASVRQCLVTRLLEDEPPDVEDGRSLGVTCRERELLGWLAHGMTNQEIARQMYLAEGSVKQYLHALGAKLGEGSRTGILMRAIRLRLVDPYRLPRPR
ncbi:LuxR family two component transcriptional regulator [Propioniferax innocua]|uniref:LuxR family two component transcriptional regulator n=2 Tax=Propioniferax innocua TaxID=1753 RepID=A0A542ZCT5_9ACTN|nr:LuxR family two component transcriptional regulator [Propioniferax innocua]